MISFISLSAHTNMTVPAAYTVRFYWTHVQIVQWLFQLHILYVFTGHMFRLFNDCSSCIYCTFLLDTCSDCSMTVPAAYTVRFYWTHVQTVQWLFQLHILYVFTEHMFKLFNDCSSCIYCTFLLKTCSDCSNLLYCLLCFTIHPRFVFLYRITPLH